MLLQIWFYMSTREMIASSINLWDWWNTWRSKQFYFRNICNVYNIFTILRREFVLRARCIYFKFHEFIKGPYNMQLHVQLFK